jgi:hypothetical protein
MTSGALMPRARTAAADATVDVSGLVARIGGSDPVDVLLERIHPVAARSVDALQIAAWLEASGMTDRAARVEYGYADVFELSEAVFRRADLAAHPGSEIPSTLRAARDLGHGALYLLPAAVFPAAIAALGAGVMVRGILLIAWVCWVTSGVAAWLAYRLMGTGRPDSARRVLLWSSLAALPLAAVLGLLIVRGHTAEAIALAVAQAAYQMGGTILVFYRREVWIFAAMVPAALAGVCYLAVGAALLGPAVALGASSVAIIYGAAIAATARRKSQPEPPLRPLVVRELRHLSAVAAFTALTAAYFLYPQTYLLPGHVGVAIGALAVTAGMGFVEWQAHRFGDRAYSLLFRVGRPAVFALGARWLMLRGLGACLAGVGLLAAVLLAVLAFTGAFTAAVAVMSAASVLLAGAYYLAFLLANMNRYAELCLNLLACLAAFAVGARALGGSAADAAVALAATTTILLLLNLVCTARVSGQAWRHRR